MKKRLIPLTAIICLAAATNAYCKDIGPHGFGRPNPEASKREKPENSTLAKQYASELEIFLRWHRNTTTLREWADPADGCRVTRLPATEL